MATAIERAPATTTANFWPVALPLAALTAVWLTVAGHTSNFREMDAARGWITSEGYSLHSALLLSIALSLLGGPFLARGLSARTQTLIGLTAVAAGSLLNGTLLHVPLAVLVAGRVLAGGGVGQVMFAGPRLLPSRRGPTFDWFAIVMPAFGPLVIAGASMLYGWSSWEGGFLFEGVLALFGLACIVALPPARESPPIVYGSLAWWPLLAVAAAALWYVLHWGHLRGWFADHRILLVVFTGAVAVIAALWLAWPDLDPSVVREAAPRIALVGYAGMVQFFNVSEMGAYGGLMINLSAWQRATLIWSVSIGAALALVVGRLFFQRRSPGRTGTLIGLLALTAGMILAYRTTLSWPFWVILNPIEFNWFAAPQHWELAPARLLMGFGSSFILLAETSRSSPDPVREARIRPSLQVTQFVGGAIGIGLLATGLLFGHQLEYAYTSDRGYLQSTEVADRQASLHDVYAASGAADPARKAEVAMYRSVGYQADNLLFADIYGLLAGTSLVLGVLVATRMLFGLIVAGVHRSRGRTLA